MGKLRFVILTLVFIAQLGYAQNNIEIEFNSKEINACTKFSKNVPLFVAELTKNKSTDKEKFDALFAWVALNIKYNYNAYYSSSGNSTPDIKRVLKRKKGICMDYSYLMDSLCRIANIPSYVVYGYSKDEIFDLNDSLHYDNHAWNAVKLENEWYVYDVTWASGKVDVRPSKFGRFIIKSIGRFKQKSVSKKITIKGSKKNSYCKPDAKETETRTYNYTKIKYRFNWPRKILLKIPYRFVKYYDNRLNNNFYLTEPRVFAITHFPDNPMWSLVPNKTFHNFLGDSAYYYLNNETYKTQIKQGYSCPECDYTYGFNQLKRNEDLLSKSFKSNSRNRFVTFECEFNIGSIKYEESKPVIDSLSKITLLDTSLAYLVDSKKSLDDAKKHIGKGYSLQKNKNTTKRKIFVSNHQSNRNYIKEVRKSTNFALNQHKVTNRNFEGAKKRYFQRSTSIYKVETDFKTKKLINNPTLEEELKTKNEYIQNNIDSLNLLIDSLKNKLNVQFPSLNDSLIKALKEYYLFMSPFEQKTQLRAGFLDDYKKDIIDKKNFIESYKISYKTYLDSALFIKTKQIYEEYILLNKKTELRNKLSNELIQVTKKEVKNQLKSAADLDQLKEKMQAENKTDICWITENERYARLMANGYNYLKFNFTFLDKLLREEYIIEGYRYNYINSEIARRLGTSRNINNHNRKVNFYKTKAVKKYKKEYLKALKDERKKKK